MSGAVENHASRCLMREWWQIPAATRTYNRFMTGQKPIAENRKARHDYHLLERFEAGLGLAGSEGESLPAGRGSRQQAHADGREGAARRGGARLRTHEHGRGPKPRPARRPK